MTKLIVVLFVIFVSAPPKVLLCQTTHWEALDGPYRPEQRTHLRFPDGDRRYYGASTGTFRTSDGGNSWAKIGAWLTSFFPSTVTVFQSPTGMLFGHLTYSDSYMHDVQVNILYRSSDRGEHWETSWGGPPQGGELPKGEGTLWGGLTFAGGDTLYISYAPYDRATGDVTTNVLQSTDAGTTWTTILTKQGYLSSLRIQNNNLFATYSWHSYSNILRSTDLGITWQAITAEDAYFYPPNILLRHLPFMISGYYMGPEVYLEISTDEGATWTRTLTADSGFTSLVSDDVATILVLRKPALELFRSTDAGQTWSGLGAVPSGDPFTWLKFYGKTHVVGITKAGFYFRSTDYGTSWMPILNPEGNPLTGTLQSATDSLLVVADWRGNWLESDDAGASWRSISHPFEAENITSMIDLPSGSLVAAGTGSVYRRRAGEPWSVAPYPKRKVLSLCYRFGSCLFAGEPASYINNVGRNFSYLSAIDTAFSANRPLGTGGGPGDIGCIFLSANGRWILFGSGREIRKQYYAPELYTPWGIQDYCLQLTGSFTAIIEDSSHAIWAANDSLGLYRSLDTGLTWSASNAGLTNLRVLSMVVASNGEIYAGTRGGVFRSPDNGSTWVCAGLSSDTVQTLLAGTGSVLYAGTTKGVSASTDDGVTWLDISSGLTNKDIHALAEGPDGTVYCGTWGDGVYRLVGKVGTPSGMVLVEGSSFSMGSATGDPDEQPVHPVTLHSFYLDPKEVTVAEYRAFCTATARSLPPAPAWGWVDALPVANVTWDDAAAYAQWKGKRLPTEAEWEYAARGGKLSHGYLYSGSAAVDSVAWDSLTSGSAPHAGGGKKANELGLYDMSGNVWEWCSDYYDASYYSVSPATNPQGPASGVGKRVLRGGSFNNPPSACRVSDRNGFWHDSGLEDVGFRLAMDAPLSSAREPQGLTAPTSFALEQNYPNPFNPRTVVRSQTPEASHVRIVIYDVLGREVAVMVNERRAAGRYQDTFDASALASGIYICRMTAGAFVKSTKMLLVK